MEHRLQLSDEPDAVPAARRYVRACLRGTPLEHRCDDAEVVLTELVTNATLYAPPPVNVGVHVLADRVRLEVSDGSGTTPLRPKPEHGAMTGRGLLLVEACTDKWGVERRARGKVVWAEIGRLESGSDVPPEPASRAEPVLPADEQVPIGVFDDEPRFVIELGDVPTDLLLAAKGHVDNLVREFTLATFGASSGQSAAVSPHLAGLIEIVTTRFAEPRQAIKRQALAAAHAGEVRTRLVLNLPLSAVHAGREYLAALDEVDNYARAARLLTLETPPQHRAFRHWYVNSLVDQLPVLERGEEARPTVPFEQFLLDELETVALAQRATERSARLQKVTASLAGATSIEEVATVTVAQGVDALGAAGGALLVPRGDDRIDVLAHLDYAETVLQHLRTEELGAQLPGSVALRTGQPVWMESPEQRDIRFPALRALEPDTVSMCAVPLALAGRVLGVLRLSFVSPRLFDEHERDFVLAFAAQAVQALDRSELDTSQRRARAEAEHAARRLRRLNQITAALAAASDADQISEIVAVEARRTLGAAVSALCLLESDDTLRVVEMQGTQPGARARWPTFPLASNLPASEAVRTNQAVVVRSRAEMESRYPDLAGQAPAEQSLVCVPLSIGGRTLGALCLSFLSPHAIDEDVEDLVSIGRQCALAVERARLVAAERAARQRSSFLADGTARVTSSLDEEETMGHLADLVVPALADWAVVYLTDDVGRVVAATGQHRDPEMTQRMQEVQRDRSPDEAPTGAVDEVLRTGQSFSYAVVPAELRAELSRLGGGNKWAPALLPSSAQAVPLVRRGRVLGALVLARIDGPPYTGEDLMLALEVAARAAVALDNAERFRREREAAVTLQRSLLPQVMPRLPGLALAWRYLPGAAGTHVGGDWYDVIQLDDGRLALVIGDVMGRGLQAAAVMGQLRATTRAQVSGDVGPAEVLARIDLEFVRLEQDQIATVLLGLLDPRTGMLTIASAGHLPPLVRTGEGAAHYLDVAPGPPLGTGKGGYTEVQVALPEAATVLLFTDGLVEDRSLPIDEGMAALAAAAVEAWEPELLCDRALAALGRDTEHDDDTAMLAVHLGDLGARPALPREDGAVASSVASSVASTAASSVASTLNA